MSHKFKSQKSVEVDINEIEELLAKLTPEEVELLGDVVVYDPDDPLLPPHLRCKNQTSKSPTGPFNRQNLIKHMEDQSKREPDREENKPFVKEVRGKVWQPPPPPKPEKIDSDTDDITTEWDEVLGSASEADLVELAAILGYTGMVNQVQFYAAQKAGSGEHVSFGGWRAVAKSEPLKLIKPEPDNSTDVDESIKRVSEDDSTLTSLNLNNIKNISFEKMIHIIEGMKTNTNIKELSMCNIDMPDHVGKELVGMLEENTTLATLNIESNLLTGPVIADICQATLKNQTLVDLRLSNQRGQILGNKIENIIGDIISQNRNLLRLGLNLDTCGPRVKIHETLKRNWEKLRLKRVGEKSSDE